MPTKAMSVQMVMFHMAGNSRMRIFTFHPEKAARLNIFGMITKRNQYKGFTTKESINADKIVDYLDRFSFNLTKKTVIV